MFLAAEARDAQSEAGTPSSYGRRNQPAFGLGLRHRCHAPQMSHVLPDSVCYRPCSPVLPGAVLTFGGLRVPLLRVRCAHFLAVDRILASYLRLSLLTGPTINTIASNWLNFRSTLPPLKAASAHLPVAHGGSPPSFRRPSSCFLAVRSDYPRPHGVLRAAVGSRKGADLAVFRSWVDEATIPIGVGRHGSSSRAGPEVVKGARRVAPVRCPHPGEPSAKSVRAILLIGLQVVVEYLCASYHGVYPAPGHLRRGGYYRAGSNTAHLLTPLPRPSLIRWPTNLTAFLG